MSSSCGCGGATRVTRRSFGEPRRTGESWCPWTKNFGALVFFRERQHCGLVRLPDVPARSRILLMQQVLQSHADDLAAGAIVTIRGSRIRVTGVKQGES